MIVPEGQRPQQIVVDAHIKDTESTVYYLGDANHEEALAIAAFLYTKLEKIKRDTDALAGVVDNALGYDDNL